MDPIYTMAFILIVSETLDELYFLSDLFCQLAQLICVDVFCLSQYFCYGDFCQINVTVPFFCSYYIPAQVKLMKQRKSENADNTKQNKDLCTQPVCLDFGEEIFAMSSIYAEL
ncbi:hypothetical protein T02_14800 [Trichinella nativa]|uniref:Uncharacterized protein n=1 Tax=Trichinella nativa TaxID=6335 RepID=A0A0V1KUD3_9BILA|nr:hypothetical protein T02_14800 [Trichinella nativa]